MRFAVGDVHGHRTEVRAALEARGLIDDAGDWTGGEHEVWFMGDLLDRGPDGVGVIEDVMRWQQQAEQTGGLVGSVLGNHEVLAVGFRRFKEIQLAEADPLSAPRSFILSWLINGGQVRDQELLTEEMAHWMRSLPAIARVGDDLLMHADTTEYLRWGADIASINSVISDILHGHALVPAWDVWASMTSRYAFVEDEGPQRARAMLDALGGSRIVHGHSIIGDLTDTPSNEVTEAWSYCEGLALAVDGGIYAGGPSLVVPLDEH